MGRRLPDLPGTGRAGGKATAGTPQIRDLAIWEELGLSMRAMTVRALIETAASDPVVLKAVRRWLKPD